MKTYDVKNRYCPQPTRVDRGREEFVNSLKIYWSWQILMLYNQSLQFFLQKYQFGNKDRSHILCHKYAGNSLAKNYKSSNSQ
jgi:hypothetical protein